MRETVEGKNQFLYFQRHFCPAFWTRGPACSFCARSKSKNYVTGPEWNTHTQIYKHDLLTNSCPVCQYIYTVNICRFGNFSNIFNFKEMPVPSSHQFSSIPWSHNSAPRVIFSFATGWLWDRIHHPRCGKPIVFHWGGISVAVCWPCPEEVRVLKTHQQK